MEKKYYKSVGRDGGFFLSAPVNFVYENPPRPDQPFRNFGALKSVSRCSLATQNIANNGGSIIVKGPVGTDSH